MGELGYLICAVLLVVAATGCWFTWPRGAGANAVHTVADCTKWSDVQPFYRWQGNGTRGEGDLLAFQVRHCEAFQ
jgi:hypothetical protein